jgi:VanZ family protein
MGVVLHYLLKRPFWLRALCLGVVTLVLLCAGLREQPIEQMLAEEDKLHHWLGFLVFALSARLAFPRARWLWIALGCLLLGLLIEGVQAWLPLRTASIGDMLANSLGVVTGLLIAWRGMR